MNRTPLDNLATPSKLAAGEPFKKIGKRLVFLCPCLFLCLAGCRHPHPAARNPIQVEPQVQIVQAEMRTISRTVGQPGFITAYEQTPLYPKIAGYIEKWNVDIGDRIKKRPSVQAVATVVGAQRSRVAVG